MDVVAQMGPSFLGSRLKRLGERMQAGAAAVITEAGLPLQPGQMAVMAALRTGEMNVGELAEASGSSQPGVTRVLGQLRKLGMIEDRPGPDQRSRRVALSPAGAAAADMLTREVWPRVGEAARQVLEGEDGDFLRRLARIERLLGEATIAERARNLAPASLRIRRFEPELAADFRDINMEWIEDMYSLEQTDRDVLDHPTEHFIEAGGDILFVEAPGLGVVGTVALQKTGPGAFELTKMGVRASARGLKAGQFLLEAAIERAYEMGATRLYLLTNRKSAAAIHLYEKYGFVHDADIMATYGARYARCDVAMRHVKRAA